jgi:hypothetical protein
MSKWNSIIENLKNQQGSTVTTDPSRWNLDNTGYHDIYQMWSNANFNSNSIKWINYYPGTNFSDTVIEELRKELNLKKIHRSWISCIEPGYMAPWHWDVDDNEEKYLSYGSITRFTIIIRNMVCGQILIVGENYYYNQKENTIIKWDNYKEWHSGINAGMEPSYMLHILGLEN